MIQLLILRARYCKTPRVLLVACDHKVLVDLHPQPRRDVDVLIVVRVVVAEHHLWETGAPLLGILLQEDPDISLREALPREEALLQEALLKEGLLDGPLAPARAPAVDRLAFVEGLGVDAFCLLESLSDEAERGRTVEAHERLGHVVPQHLHLGVHVLVALDDLPPELHQDDPELRELVPGRLLQVGQAVGEALVERVDGQLLLLIENRDDVLPCTLPNERAVQWRLVLDEGAVDLVGPQPHPSRFGTPKPDVRVERVRPRPIRLLERLNIHKQQHGVLLGRTHKDGHQLIPGPFHFQGEAEQQVERVHDLRALLHQRRPCGPVQHRLRVRDRADARVLPGLLLGQLAAADVGEGGHLERATGVGDPPVLLVPHVFDHSLVSALQGQILRLPPLDEHAVPRLWLPALLPHVRHRPLHPLLGGFVPETLSKGQLTPRLERVVPVQVLGADGEPDLLLFVLVEHPSLLCRAGRVGPGRVGPGVDHLALVDALRLVRQVGLTGRGADRPLGRHLVQLLEDVAVVLRLFPFRSFLQHLHDPTALPVQGLPGLRAGRVPPLACPRRRAPRGRRLRLRDPEREHRVAPGHRRAPQPQLSADLPAVDRKDGPQPIHPNDKLHDL
mmetsp:Transcript_6557/g.15926  ORF Transcript_6557/g.15926 Transcript_6557/m.15926 type:complete len:617 (+) Transcript_6557:729-2579(+)